jgi:DNA-binding LytR/AlgR family response regulator
MEHITLKCTQGLIHNIAVADILYTEAQGRVVYFITREGKYTFLTTQHDAECLLTAYSFERIDGNHVANMNKIVQYNKDTQSVTFENGDRKNVSRSNKKKMKDRFDR